MKIKLFADGANIDEMIALAQNTGISGFTTNPTLMRKAGVTDYRAFAQQAIAAIPDKPISFEVIADDLLTMNTQALELASWGQNVYVKIPITTTSGESTLQMVKCLSLVGVKINVTAVMTMHQIQDAIDTVGGLAPTIVSVFAGRIADTGEDPMPFITTALVNSYRFSNVEVLWASPREVFNVYQADRVGCHIITATPDILKKLSLIGRDLAGYSLETVKMFYDDAVKAGLTL